MTEFAIGVTAGIPNVSGTIPVTSIDIVDQVQAATDTATQSVAAQNILLSTAKAAAAAADTAANTAKTDASTADTAAIAADTGMDAMIADETVDVEAAVAVLEADGASPTQAHVNALRTVWNLLKTEQIAVAVLTNTAKTNTATAKTSTTTAKAATATAKTSIDTMTMGQVALDVEAIPGAFDPDFGQQGMLVYVDSTVVTDVAALNSAFVSALDFVRDEGILPL
jgi:hypothetical protein